MPAVTVDDILAIERLPDVPDGLGREREVRSVTTAPHGYEGNGFPVRRAFAGVALSELDPFVHMDQMGEVQYGAGEAKGTPWHPHRGFATVTYMIDGTFEHQDSNGGGGRITDGGTQWMTAGAGILHIEAPPEALVVSGGLFHGIQLWVNLPRAEKWVAPSYQSILGTEARLVASQDGGALLRVIAGQVSGHRGPAPSFTPVTVVHASVSPAAEFRLPWPPGFNALVYVLAGDAHVGSQRQRVRAGQLVIFGPGDHLQVGAQQSQDLASPNAELLVLGGQPLREPVVHYGPFVMNTEDEILQAMQDYREGRLGKVPVQTLAHHRGDARVGGGLS